MDKKDLTNYILEKYDCFLDFPFDKLTAVFKHNKNNKMFALIRSGDDFVINLKCDPDEAIILREIYKGVTAGYHMNKKHWNSVCVNKDVPIEIVKDLIEKSYDLVKSKTKKGK